MLSDPGVNVSICICTYQRAGGLANCLASLQRLEIPPALKLEVLVVDNDPAASACELVMAATPTFALPLRYVNEPRSGVSHARNRCLVEARGGWVAFVDDDEFVEPAWLQHLWLLAAAGAVDGVFGPVLAKFEQLPPAWLLTSGAHQRPRSPTGTTMRWGDCRAGNVLFKRQLFLAHGGFDARFAASGGEDTDFFWRCQALGARLVWCDEAVVYETVPPARMTRAWLLKRAYNGGRTFARVRASRGGWRSQVVDSSWGLLNLLMYALPALLARLGGLPRALAFERKVAGGLGKLAAPFTAATGDYGSGAGVQGAAERSRGNQPGGRI